MTFTLNSLTDKAVLITGGTRGIGLATGLAFGRHGALCTLTHRWGSANEDEIRRQFAAAGAPEPFIVQADVSNDDDTTALLEAMKERHEQIEILVANVALALLVRDIDAYKKRALYQSMDYTTWPMFAYTKRIEQVFGRYPRYIIGLSSVGPDHYIPNYDFVAACKATLETLARYASHHLGREDVHINIVRSGYVLTESLRATLGEEFEVFAQRFNMQRQAVLPAEVANVVLALCSGLLDGINGQIIVAGRDAAFADDLQHFYREISSQHNSR